MITSDNNFFKIIGEEETKRYFETAYKWFQITKKFAKEETNRVHYTLKKYKNITNFEQTKETLENMKLELPNVPDIADIGKFSRKRNERI